MTNTAVKTAEQTIKQERKMTQIIAIGLVKFLLAFFLSRTSFFLGIIPFGPSALLALGGGVFPLVGSLVGSYGVGSFENITCILAIYIIKFFIKDDKWDFLNILISLTAVFTFTILQKAYVPYDIMLKAASITFSILGYFVIKKAFKAQFVKSRQLKFSKNEAYASMFLLFAFVSGIKSENISMFVNFSDIIKFYLIAMGGLYFGIGGGTATGAILGMMAGYNFEYSALTMSVYSIFGFFTGVFSRFSKFTGMLGLLFSYVFAIMYLDNTVNVINYRDVLIAGALFMITPVKLVRPYIERYTKKEATKDMLTTINSITANRLEKLANSFTSLTTEISKTQKNINIMTKVSTNSLFDFLGEKVCKKCSLKTVCWQKEYESTVDSLTKAVNYLAHTGDLCEENFQKSFANRCTRIEEINRNCKSFYEILKINSVWKNKLTENTNAFKQQFLEMSKIICELKKNIENNKYFDAELSSELYAVLSNEGYNLKEVSIIKNANDNYMVKLDMYPCKHNENCFIKLKGIIEDVIGVSVSRVDGGCGEILCSIVFKEGVIGGIEKRVHSISKNDADPVGDSYVVAEISQNRYLIALCDGMGSGKKASVVSSSVISLLVEMLKAGFSEESTIKMINSFLIANLSGETFTTVDFMVVDTKKMTGKIVKNGACPTYIKKADGEVIEIQNQSLPAGITEQKPFIKSINLKKEDIIILVSDGTQDSVEEEDWIKNILTKLPDGSITEAVDLICGIAQRNFEKREDDVTVLGVKVV